MCYKQLSAHIKMKNNKVKSSFVSTINKTGFNFMIFQYGLEPVLIQWILIGFGAILEKVYHTCKDSKVLSDIRALRGSAPSLILH